MKLCQPGRILLEEEELQCCILRETSTRENNSPKWKKLKLYIFTDLILLSEAKKKGEHKLVQGITFEGCSVLPKCEYLSKFASKELEEYFHLCFEINFNITTHVVVRCSNEKEKEDFFSLISSAIAKFCQSFK